MFTQESSPPIQRKVEHLTANQALGVHTTEPLQPADFNFPKKHNLWPQDMRSQVYQHILQDINISTYPATAQDFYRRIYFEAIDFTVNAIDLRFD